MKLVMAGDTHGDIRNVRHKIDKAKEHGSQRVLILGDVGIWWGYEGVKFIDDVNDYARANNIQVFGIGGNHECWELWNHLVAGAYEAGATSKGWAYIRTNFLLAPKVHDFVWSNKQFVVAGGAVSIDKDYRLEYERKKGQKIWSPNEQLTDAEVDGLLDSRFGNGAMVDYLLTHDCSNMTPWKNRLKPDMESQIHRQRMDRILRGIKPRKHFHGHMHERYEWENRVGGNEYVDTYGLECNNYPDSWGILDLDTDEFIFATDL